MSPRAIHVLHISVVAAILTIPLSCHYSAIREQVRDVLFAVPVVPVRQNTLKYVKIR